MKSPVATHAQPLARLQPGVRHRGTVDVMRESPPRTRAIAHAGPARKRLVMALSATSHPNMHRGRRCSRHTMFYHPPPTPPSAPRSILERKQPAMSSAFLANSAQGGPTTSPPSRRALVGPRARAAALAPAPRLFGGCGGSGAARAPALRGGVEVPAGPEGGDVPRRRGAGGSACGGFEPGSLSERIRCSSD